MFTRSKAKFSQEAPKFRGLTTPKTRLRRAKSLTSLPKIQPSPFRSPFLISVTPSSPTVMAAQPVYPPFDGGVPLNLAHLDPIPSQCLKNLPYFDGTSHITPFEHCVAIVAQAKCHNVTQENVIVRLLALSFAGKVLDWYRGLPTDSIIGWATLAEPFILEFNEESDSYSSLMQFTTIKRDERESVIDFNIRFQREWKRIPQATKPSSKAALVYYLRAFHPNLSLQIRNRGSRTFPEIYRDAIVAETDLIASAKLPMRTPRFLIVRPVFHHPGQEIFPADQAPPLALIPFLGNTR